MRRGSEGSVPTGWKEERGSNGEKVFTHLATNAIVIISFDNFRYFRIIQLFGMRILLAYSSLILGSIG